MVEANLWNENPPVLRGGSSGRSRGALLADGSGGGAEIGTWSVGALRS
jgi:hypothetical protein